MEPPNINWKPDLIVLGPGGMKGFLELGSIFRLQYEPSFFENVHTYVGVSVGAIISLLLVCNYDIPNIVIDSIRADIFEDISKFSISNIQSNIGIVSNNAIRKRIATKVEKKFGMIPTLKELYEKTGLKFVSVTANLDKEITEYISYQNEPSLSCVEAVMLSMNIPIIFYKLKYKNCVYADGALGNPYPIDIWDDGKTNILGIYTKSTRKTSSEPASSSSTLYIHKIIHFSMTQIRNKIIENASDKCKHIELESDIIDSTGITITPQDKAMMLITGYQIADAFLKKEIYI